MGKDPEIQALLFFSSLKSWQAWAARLHAGCRFAAPSSGFTARWLQGAGGSPGGTVPTALPTPTSLLSTLLFPNFLGVPQRPLAPGSPSELEHTAGGRAGARGVPGGAGSTGHCGKWVQIPMWNHCLPARGVLSQPRHPPWCRLAPAMPWGEERHWPGPAGSACPPPPKARSFTYGYFPFPPFNVNDSESHSDDPRRESRGNLVPAWPRSHRRQRLLLPGATAGKLRLASKLPSLRSRANAPHLHFIVIFCFREMLRYYRTG